MIEGPQRQYLSPNLWCTGTVAGQPKVEDTQPGWYFDRNYRYLGTGFIDAPTRIPSGSQRALDTGPLTLAITHVWRAGELS